MQEGKQAGRRRTIYYNGSYSRSYKVIDYESIDYKLLDERFQSRLFKFIDIGRTIDFSIMYKHTFKYCSVVGIKNSHIDQTDLCVERKIFLKNAIRPNLARLEKFLDLVNVVPRRRWKRYRVPAKIMKGIHEYDIITANLALVEKDFLSILLHRYTQWDKRGK